MINRSVDKLFEFENELSLLKSKTELKAALFDIRELIESSNNEEAICKLTELIEQI